MWPYIFVTLMLPSLQLGAEPPISLTALEELLSDNLTRRDNEKARTLRRYFDIENVRTLWKKQPIDSRGNWNKRELEERLLNEGELRPYIRKFMEKYERREVRIEHFSELFTAYFRYESTNNSGFVARYLDFERKVRLLQCAYRAKALQRDLLEVLQFEDGDDPFVGFLIAQRNVVELEFPEQFSNLKLLFSEQYHTPLKLYEAMQEYRFQHIEEMIGQYPQFSLDRILGYLVQLIIVESRFSLGKKEGKPLLDTYVSEALP